MITIRIKIMNTSHTRPTEIGSKMMINMMNIFQKQPAEIVSNPQGRCPNGAQRGAVTR